MKTTNFTASKGATQAGLALSIGMSGLMSRIMSINATSTLTAAQAATIEKIIRSGKFILNIAGDNSVQIIIDSGNIYLCGKVVNTTDSDFAVIKINKDGELVTTWGTGGKTIIDISGSSSDSPVQMILDGSKNIYVGGTSDNDFAIVRLDNTGALDTTWGTRTPKDGRAIIDISGGADNVTHMIEDSGKLYVGGYGVNGLNTDFAVVRLDNTGALDTTWGNRATKDGRAIIDIASNNDQAVQMILDSGNLYVGGYGAGSITSNDFAVVRLNASGVLDTTWGTGGKAIVDISNSTTDNAAQMILKSGNLYVGGNTSTRVSDFAVVRLNSSGALDTTWGTRTPKDGKAIIDISGSADSFVQMIEDSGTLYIGGTGNDSINNKFAVVRLDSSGVLDTTWGTGGKAFVGVNKGGNPDTFVQMILDSGNIYAAGYSGSGTSEDVVALKLKSDGTLDTTWGTGGKTIVNIQGDSDQAVNMILDSGNLYIAGDSFKTGATMDFAIIKLDAKGKLANDFGAKV
jgi:uncharacterized delta-60 repeat protein